MNGSVHSSDPSASLDMQDSCICLSVSPLTILILRKVATSVTPQICSYVTKGGKTYDLCRKGHGEVDWWT